MALVNTYVTIPSALLNILSKILPTICLLMAMVALGLNVAFKDLKNRALKPLIQHYYLNMLVITCLYRRSLAIVVNTEKTLKHLQV